MPLGSAILGTIGLLGGLANTGLSVANSHALQRKSYKYALKLQQDQQAWQERMRANAHQVEVADLRKAGLNPILSATGGSGASFSNASGSPVSAPAADIDIGLDKGLNTALSVVRLDSDLRTASAQQKLLDAQAEEAKAKAKEISSGLPLNRLPGAAWNGLTSNRERIIDRFSDLLVPLFKDSRPVEKIVKVERVYPPKIKAHNAKYGNDRSRHRPDPIPITGKEYPYHSESPFTFKKGKNK